MAYVVYDSLDCNYCFTVGIEFCHIVKYIKCSPSMHINIQYTVYCSLFSHNFGVWVYTH